MSQAYAHPEKLVDSQWVQDHLQDPTVRLIEIDVDTAAYEEGHIPGAIGFNWTTQLEDQLTRDLPSREQWDQLLSDAGIGNDHKIIVYGDNNNWFAAFGLWIFEIYGHQNVQLMNGGRKLWLAENRPLSKDVPHYPTTQYKSSEADLSLRSFYHEVRQALKDGTTQLVDVRSPDEFSGKIIAPAGMTETAQRGGHIPTAKNIPWGQAVKDDGTFKSADDLRQLYRDRGIEDNKETIAYCRIGERSSLTWFVLKYLLGFPNVRNYDGSWTEYGSVVAAPIEKP
ncbi:MAG: sulfurtransferase [Armatimonadota bacterium]|nr:sulfurtransferase [Armatimonadota bacterium]